MKTCRICGQELPLDNFQKAGIVNGKQYHKAFCKECNKQHKALPFDVKVGAHRDAFGELIKPCTGCEQNKPLDAFRRHTKGIGYRPKCKECEATDQQARRKKDPEKARRYAREYAAKHPEYVRTKNKRWQEQNKEYRSCFHRKHYRLNAEAKREYAKQYRARLSQEEKRAHDRRSYLSSQATHKVWRERNRERIALIRRQWQQNNLQKHADRQQRRRAWKRNCPVIESVSRAEIIARDGTACYLCGRVLNVNEVTLDHVHPLSRSGSHTTSNIRIACRSCNSRKGAKLLSEIEIK